MKERRDRGMEGGRKEMRRKGRNISCPQNIYSLLRETDMKMGY